MIILLHKNILFAEFLHFAGESGGRGGSSPPGESVIWCDFQLRDRKAETAKQRKKIDQQECAPGGLSPTNMLIAKTLYFAIPGTKRIMQECAPGDKGGAAIGFAKMRFAICSLNHCNLKAIKNLGKLQILYYKI